MSLVRFVLPALCLIAAVGCGGGEDFPTAPVSGTVLCNGKPVSGGMVMFLPQGEPGQTLVGKAAQGLVGDDGSFTLSTYSEGDGAVVGRHTVSYSAAVEGAPPPPPNAPCANVGNIDVEIPEEGDENLTIDLSAAG